MIVLTGSWSAMYRFDRDLEGGLAASEFLPVRISVGLPRFWPQANKFPVIKPLTPYGLRGLTGQEFKVAYEQRLEKAGPIVIAHAFAELHKEYGGRTLVLLCFEKDRQECHRGQFAAWWRSQAGFDIEEVILP